VLTSVRQSSTSSIEVPYGCRTEPDDSLREPERADLRDIRKTYNRLISILYWTWSASNHTGRGRAATAPRGMDCACFHERGQQSRRRCSLPMIPNDEHIALELLSRVRCNLTEKKMKKLVSSVFVVSLVTAAAQARAWDPIGDITHPERIIRNVGREAGNVGRDIDRARLEAQVQAGAPVFQSWLNESRSNARRSGTSPIPPNVRAQLQGFYDELTLNRASFKVGDPGVFNLANLSIQYGGAGAVTLIDTIVFRDGHDAQNNASLWAHELKHVQQFNSWGTRDFAIRYLRSWNSVEGEAYAAERSYQDWANRRLTQTEPPRPPFPPQTQSAAATVCATPYGMCPMAVPINIGTACYCPTMHGPIWGVSR
jgi:hypothetical protein